MENQTDRRRYARVKKTFILSYCLLDDPSRKFEITQLKNISLGGICFVSSQDLTPGVQLGVDLKTPYVADKTYLTGHVLESHPKVKGMLYETRLAFSGLKPETEVILTQLIEFFLNEGKKRYE
ncbi:MAG: PilZ domain-containing protein [Candidatus Omnitrophica bacterium]|nr:PilZ domain-containing protein [Candidatus Omnitrophota bacterium]